MFIPYRCKNPPESLPIATYSLILVNVVVYAFTTDQFLFIREPIVEEYGLKFSEINARDGLVSLFLHGNLLHLLGNMWFLHIFGSAVEGRLRTPLFLVLYFVAGFAGDALQLGVFGPAEPDMPGIGASGAIMGLMGAALYMFPFSQIDVFYRVFYSFGTTTWQLRWVALLYVGIDMLEALLIGESNGVANLAHLGGAGGGYLFVLAIRARRDTEQASEAKAVLAESKDYSILAPYELAELAKTNPRNTLIILHWMMRSQKEIGGPKPECKSAFFANLDRMIVEQPPESVATALLAFVSEAQAIPPRAALNLAMRLESGMAPHLALQLYDIVLRGQRAEPQEELVAIMRGGILCENRLEGKDRAIAAYREILRRDPMGPFAQQARHRLDSLQRAGTP